MNIVALITQSHVLSSSICLEITGRNLVSPF